MIVVDRALSVGKAANAAAVLALTVGQRHPGLVGAALVDGSGQSHPGLIPIGITVLAASQQELSLIQSKGRAAACDIVIFPVPGQQSTDYVAFRAAVAGLPESALQYIGLALVGDRKPISKIVASLGLLK